MAFGSSPGFVWGGYSLRGGTFRKSPKPPSGALAQPRPPLCLFLFFVGGDENGPLSYWGLCPLERLRPRSLLLGFSLSKCHKPRSGVVEGQGRSPEAETGTGREERRWAAVTFKGRCCFFSSSASPRAEIQLFFTMKACSEVGLSSPAAGRGALLGPDSLVRAVSRHDNLGKLLKNSKEHFCPSSQPPAFSLLFLRGLPGFPLQGNFPLASQGSHLAGDKPGQEDAPVLVPILFPSPLPWPGLYSPWQTRPLHAIAVTPLLAS